MKFQKGRNRYCSVCHKICTGRLCKECNSIKSSKQLSKKKKLAFISHVISFGLMFNLFVVFVAAYMNNYVIGVYVNEYGEAHFEMILFPLTIIFCFIGLFFAWRDLKNVAIREAKEKESKDAKANR